MDDSKKELLKIKLFNKNINIKDEDLEEIISIYDNIIDFLIELAKVDKDYCNDRYDFIFNDWNEDNNNAYFNLFGNIAILKRKGLINYLDYLLIIRYMFGDIYSAICDINFYLYSIIEESLYGDNDSIEHVYDDDINVLNKTAIKYYYNGIINSKCVPDYYKNIITIYNNIFDICKDKTNIIKQSEINDEVLLSSTYYYFMYNDLFNKNPLSVYNFLKYICDNLLDILDKINLLGIRNNIDLFSYIDDYYKNYNNKVMVIK